MDVNLHELQTVSQKTRYKLILQNLPKTTCTILHLDPETAS